MTRTTALSAVILACALLGGGCDEVRNDPGTPGPCYHEYRSPVLMIDAATELGTGADLGTVLVTTVTIDGRELDLQELLWSTHRNVELVDGVLEGRVPFGFGIEEGRYTLEITAPGCLNATVTADAAYEISHGGCPSFNDGATEIAVGLHGR